MKCKWCGGEVQKIVKKIDMGGIIFTVWQCNSCKKKQIWILEGLSEPEEVEEMERVLGIELVGALFYEIKNL